MNNLQIANLVLLKLPLKLKQLKIRQELITFIF